SPRAARTRMTRAIEVPRAPRWNGDNGVAVRGVGVDRFPARGRDCPADWRTAGPRAKMTLSPPSPLPTTQPRSEEALPMAIAENRTFAPAEGSTLETKLYGKIRVNADALTELVAAFFRHNNMPAEDALTSAKGIVLADLVGHESHGVSNNLAGFYLPDLESGVVNPRPNIRITRESPSTATWEADHAMGFVVATRAMEDAIERASKV